MTHPTAAFLAWNTAIQRARDDYTERGNRACAVERCPELSPDHRPYCRHHRKVNRR